MQSVNQHIIDSEHSLLILTGGLHSVSRQTGRVKVINYTHRDVVLSVHVQDGKDCLCSPSLMCQSGEYLTKFFSMFLPAIA